MFFHFGVTAIWHSNPKFSLNRTSRFSNLPFSIEYKDNPVKSSVIETKLILTRYGGTIFLLCQIVRNVVGLTIEFRVHLIAGGVKIPTFDSLVCQT